LEFGEPRPTGLPTFCRTATVRGKTALEPDSGAELVFTGGGGCSAVASSRARASSAGAPTADPDEIRRHRCGSTGTAAVAAAAGAAGAAAGPAAGCFDGEPLV
jgi:hypothetical protein